MPESKPRLPAPTEPGIDLKPMQDLELDASQSKGVRGGFWGDDNGEIPFKASSAKPGASRP